jgi:hypothetical protein
MGFFSAFFCASQDGKRQEDRERGAEELQDDGCEMARGIVILITLYWNNLHAFPTHWSAEGTGKNSEL